MWIPRKPPQLGPRPWEGAHPPTSVASTRGPALGPGLGSQGLEVRRARRHSARQGRFLESKEPPAQVSPCWCSWQVG